MKKMKWLMGTIVCSGLLMSMPLTQVHMEETTVQEEGKDALVEIDQDMKFLSMNKKDKEKIYAELDEISVSNESEKKINEYVTIKEIDSDKAFDEVLKLSKKERVIVYLGYDECPYCKAFSPKLTHLTNEAKVDVYYYDVQVRQTDKNFRKNIEFFDVEFVPNAFIVENGKVVKNIDDKSIMLDIEDFVRFASEKGI